MDERLKETSDKFVTVCQRYQDAVPLPIVGCAMCGSTHFQVAQANYETYIRCVHCQSEILIHEG